MGLNIEWSAILLTVGSHERDRKGERLSIAKAIKTNVQIVFTLEVVDTSPWY
jgi:hypothetical protein